MTQLLYIDIRYDTMESSYRELFEHEPVFSVDQSTVLSYFGVHRTCDPHYTAVEAVIFNLLGQSAVCQT